MVILGAGLCITLLREREDDKMDDAFSDLFLKREPKFLGKVPLDTELDLEISLGYAEFYRI